MLDFQLLLSNIFIQDRANPTQDLPSAATRGVNQASQSDKCIDHFTLAYCSSNIHRPLETTGCNLEVNLTLKHCCACSGGYRHWWSCHVQHVRYLGMTIVLPKRLCSKSTSLISSRFAIQLVVAYMSTTNRNSGVLVFQLTETKSSAVAERPLDAPCGWKSLLSLKIVQGHSKLHRWLGGV